MTTAVYPGSFDPLTMGHLDVITRAAGVFDTVTIGIAHNAAKTGHHLFDLETRQELARNCTAHLGNVQVDVIEGLLADYCREKHATVIVKGLRNGTDLDAEVPMALLNRDLGGPETLFLTATPLHAHVSSSLVKDVASHGGDISALVPAPVHAAMATIFDIPATAPTERNDS